MVRSGSIASIELPWHVGFTPSGRIAATPRTVERGPIADTSKLLAACLNAHCRSTLLGCTMSDPKDQEESGRATPLRLSALFSGRAYTLSLSTAEELSHNHPARRLQLWAASPYDRRRIGAYLAVSLSGVPASYWRRI